MICEAALFLLWEPSQQKNCFLGAIIFGAALLTSFRAFQKISPIFWIYDNLWFLKPRLCRFAPRPPPKRVPCLRETIFGAALFYVSEPSLCFSFVLGTMIFEAVFSTFRTLQKYSSFFSGTIIFEAVFLHVWDAPKNIVPFFPEL